MGSGFSKRKKQAKLLEQQFSKIQEQLKTTQVTGSAANGLVQITMNGEHHVQSVKIQPDCVDPEDVEGLEDLVASAINNAVEKVKTTSSGSIPGMDFSSFLG